MYKILDESLNIVIASLTEHNGNAMVVYLNGISMWQLNEDEGE